MDLTNQKILHLLEQNSKLSLSEIGKEVNLSTPSVRERIYKLIDSKIIERYTIDINVLIEVTIKNNLYKDFKAFISVQNNVDFCYRISGDSCFIFKAHFKKMSEVETLINEIQYYGHTKTHFIFSETK
ncbi:MAG: Lrp/AsnC family transcriptional regulator [Staphylococcus epidermidis]|nr:Lrp/AsnC family transcriptional regulator [Staphylococcus epidermidis]